MESTFIGSGTVAGTGVALGIGVGFEGFRMGAVEVGGAIMGNGLETAMPVGSPVGLGACCTSFS